MSTSFTMWQLDYNVYLSSEFMEATFKKQTKLEDTRTNLQQRLKNNNQWKQRQKWSP